MHELGDVPCYKFHPLLFMSMAALGKFNSKPNSRIIQADIDI